MDEQPSPIDRVNNWFKTSVTIKLFTITVLVLLMLVPAEMIKSVINERQNLNEQSTREVSNEWAADQQITGPVLTVPITYTKLVNGNTETEYDYLQILPEKLSVNGTVDPRELKRGIYKVVVYESKMQVSGKFNAADSINNNTGGTLHWENAFLSIGISDMRGIKNALQININGTPARVTAGIKLHDLPASGVTIPYPIQANAGTLDFNFNLDLQGSNNLSFVPVGNTTDIKITSPWSSPSFMGNFLPDERTVDESGFTAQWNVLQLNRNYPQTWQGDQYFEAMQSSAFGVDLIQSLGDYQKSMRSVKYAILTIALTFLVFFLTEILNGNRIHPFQYILVGLALCLFYILLVSLSEQMPFNSAYFIAAGTIIFMITFYARAVFRSMKLALILSIILVGLYSFLFVTLQMSDYALLMGSIGLTVMLGLTMYFTRKIDWYSVRKKSSPEINPAPVITE